MRAGIPIANARNSGKLDAHHETSFFLCLFLLVPALLADKPNIIFIMADDLGWTELAHTDEENQDATPRPACARRHAVYGELFRQRRVPPSRCVLMTGKHPGHAFVRNNKEFKPEGNTPYHPKR